MSHMRRRSTKCRPHPTMVLIIVVLLFGGATSPLASGPMPQMVYVELALYSQEAEALSVIVTGGELQAAARTVEQVGGQVTSDLWLIDAVAATIPTGRLQALATYPGIRSIEPPMTTSPSICGMHLTWRQNLCHVMPGCTYSV